MKTPPVVSIPTRGAKDQLVAPKQRAGSLGRTESEGADINEDDISESLLSGEDTSLNSGTVGDSLIRVDSLGRLLAVEVLLEKLLDLGNASGSSDETGGERFRSAA